MTMKMEMRPSRVSVTFLKQDVTIPGDPSTCIPAPLLLCGFLGLELCLNRGEEVVFQIFGIRENSVLLSNSNTMLLQVGDVLESINGHSCRNVEITDVWDMLAMDNSKEDNEDNTPVPKEGLYTLTFQCPGGCSDLVSAITIPPSNENTEVNSGDNHPEQEATTPMDNETNNHNKMSLPYDLGLELVAAAKDNVPTNRFRRNNNQISNEGLVIANLAKHGWLAQSVLTAGDCIVAVNDASFEESNNNNNNNREEVLKILSNEETAANNNIITILARRNGVQRLTWRQRAQRAGIFVGGGVMVSAGAALMVTPLHPVGHAMAIGGVAVLGRLRHNRKMAAAAGEEEGDDNATKATLVGDEEHSCGSPSLLDEEEPTSPTNNDNIKQAEEPVEEMTPCDGGQ